VDETCQRRGGTDVCVHALGMNIETGLTRDYLERDANRARLEGLVPAGRLSTPEEVAGPALFLASRRAGYITGHVLDVDGGRTLA
jgi:gluconate 5-dehydrogenase